MKSASKYPVALCIELLEPRQLFVFPNWAGIGPAIALVPQSAGQLASVSVVNFGTTVYTGPLNVTNTLNRIRADGTPDRADDGIVYNSPQASGLPVDGTYYEFTVEPTGGTDRNFTNISFPGPMRILLATGGDCYFTGDHYVTFEPVYIPGTVIAPTIGSFSVSPSSVTAGTPVTLTAANVTETGGTISAVNFYEETNSTAGLQTTGDTFVGAGAQNGTTWSINTATTGFAAGTYTYYALAIDGSSNDSAAASATLSISAVAQSGLLAGWNVNNQSGYGTQGLAATSVAAGVTNSLGLTRGTGVKTTGTASGSAWGGVNWAQTSAAGLAGSQFITFGLTVSANSTASFSAIDMNYRRSSTGPDDGYWEYQINSGSFQPIGAGSFIGQFSNSSGNATPITEITLSGINALQNLTPGTVVNFLLCPYDTTNTASTWYIDHSTTTTFDLAIDGTVISGAPLMLSGPADYLKLDPDGLHVDIWNSSIDTGAISQSLLLSQISSMSFVGTAASESLTIDFSAGDPLIPAGMSFTGAASGQNNLNIIGTSGNDLLTVGASSLSFASVPISYSNTTAITFTGGSGNDLLLQTAQPGGGASLIYAGTTISDSLTVNGGTFTFPASSVNSGIVTQTLNAISIGNGATVTVTAPSSHADRSLLVLNTLTFAGDSGNWQGQLDLSGNDMIVQNGVTTTITSQISDGYSTGAWTGQGITSSTAAKDSTHLTALGVLFNNDGLGNPLYSTGAEFGPFDGQNPPVNAVLVKYTYFGDANLDGLVNGSDYTLIDNGFNSQQTGWANGDFNYDDSINGDDYLLIDNAANAGVAGLSAIPADQINREVLPSQQKSSMAISLLNTPSAATDFDSIDLRHKARPKLWELF